MLKCILKNIQKYVIKKYFQIVLSMSKLFLSYFNIAFKQWLQLLMVHVTMNAPISFISIVLQLPYVTLVQLVNKVKHDLSKLVYMMHTFIHIKVYFKINMQLQQNSFDVIFYFLIPHISMGQLHINCFKVLVAK